MTELVHSRNISDSDMDYIPNVFDNHLEFSIPEVRQMPPLRWFLVYYRNGRCNFIYASRYLAKEIGTIPEGNLKKYVSAFEFPEEEILAMCPSSVHKVTKMRNSSNMVLLTFFGSSLPDRVHIGPINLRCYSCYGYGHGKSFCKDASRCGNWSTLDSHSEKHCDAAAYCSHCRDAHQLANSQFINLGSARRELLYHQKDGTGATSYAAGPKTSATSRSLGTGGPAVRSANGFVILFDDSVESSQKCNGNPLALTKMTRAVDVQLPQKVLLPPVLTPVMMWHHCSNCETIYE
ncbi:hypothetical protein E2C01_029572 [Portunus trituberculatus]|uniref:Uncharacterized protein n=1 Tax=Portunus trituberculatus TaxID=210409 RepID=A0A5B7EUX9_PORTR|nr:hypothetical protein [Portunus trituberculatus]